MRTKLVYFCLFSAVVLLMNKDYLSWNTNKPGMKSGAEWMVRLEMLESWVDEWNTKQSSGAVVRSAMANVVVLHADF